MNKIADVVGEQHLKHVAASLNTSQLPLSAQEYIREIVLTTEGALGPGSLVAVVLFGSLSYGKPTLHSDVDLLLIVSDRVSARELRKLRPILNAIEVKHRYSPQVQKWTDRMLHVIERNTGMFCSHFVCRMADWQQDNFARILSVNKALARLIAPDKIVLDSLKHGSRVVYGELPIDRPNNSYSHFQILKSFFMTSILAYGAILVLPISKRYVKYVLEAYKWSLRASYFYLFGKTRKLSRIISFYERIGLSNYYLRWFKVFRLRSGFHIRFCLSVPFQIMKLHLLAYRIKRNMLRHHELQKNDAG